MVDKAFLVKHIIKKTFDIVLKSSIKADVIKKLRRQSLSQIWKELR